MKKISAVEAYIHKNDTWKNELELLRTILLKTELEETIKWGSPVYTINNKNVLGLGAFKNYFGIWFFNGALLKDPYNVLLNAQEGKTKALRQWRFKHGDEVDEKLILSYVKEAILNQKEGKEIKPETHTAGPVPTVLANALKKDKSLYRAYNKLTPYKQREYAEYIGDAKQQATRQKRLEKIIPLILSGVGLNDKYRK